MKSSTHSETSASLQRAVTLVHKGAMPIAIHAVRSFSRHYGDGFLLEIHTDGSLDAEDIELLSNEAGGMAHRFAGPAERAALLGPLLDSRPHTRALASLGGYFTKLQLPMVVPGPYFYFDSDIVWLRKAENLNPLPDADIFSTETWSWYYGARNDREWVRRGVPRRVNSGFYHLVSAFPFDVMEEMLARNLFDHTTDYNTDQEIMALHFPGGMWKDHLDQIAALHNEEAPAPAPLRIAPAAPLTMREMIRMRYSLRISRMPALKYPIRGYRALRGLLKSAVSATR
jgi:hypothetical protein